MVNTILILYSLFTAHTRYSTTIDEWYYDGSHFTTARQFFTPGAGDTIFIRIANAGTLVRDNVFPLAIFPPTSGGQTYWSGAGNAGFIMTWSAAWGSSCKDYPSFNATGFTGLTVGVLDIAMIYVVGAPTNGQWTNNVKSSLDDGPITNHLKLINALNTTRDYCGSWTLSSGTLSMRVFVQKGPVSGDVCEPSSEGNCLLCAYPFQATADPENCGCIIDRTKLQSQNSLQSICYSYCQITPINGNQSYFDGSRSNFRSSNGPIVCSCSDPITKATVKMPFTGDCPEGTRITFPVDTISDPSKDSLQDVGDNPIDTAGGGGGFDSAGYRGVLDTVLRRYLGDPESGTRVIDSLDSLYGNTDTLNGFSDSALVRDTIISSGSFGADSGTLGLGFLNTFGVGDDDIRKFDTSFPVDLFGIRDTIPIDWGTMLYNMNLSPWLKAFERLAVIIWFFPWFLMIATGKEGED